jgi:aryl-alcohol dehydrogenase-like predicted oxidoreductase
VEFHRAAAVKGEVMDRAAAETALAESELIPYREEFDFSKKNNINLLCYGVLAGGFLSEHYLNVSEPKKPFVNRSLAKYKLIIDENINI